MGSAEKTWLGLVTLTLAGAMLAETGRAGWPLTLAVAGVILFKGGLVIDRYMEMPTAKVSFRRILYAFSAVLALMVLLTEGFGETLMRLTTIY